MCKFLSQHLFPVLWGHIPRSGIAELYSESKFNLLRKCPTVFPYQVIFRIKWADTFVKLLVYSAWHRGLNTSFLRDNINITYKVLAVGDICCKMSSIDRNNFLVLCGGTTLRITFPDPFLPILGKRSDFLAGRPSWVCSCLPISLFPWDLPACRQHALRLLSSALPSSGQSQALPSAVWRRRAGGGERGAQM